MEVLYVPDATVVVKWALPPAEDKGQDRSLDLLQLWLEGGCRFLLPALWVAEVASLLARLHPQRAADLMTLLIGLEMPVAEDSAALCQRTLQLMQELGVGFYQAYYHAVALQHGGTLVTADAAYCRKARSAAGLLLLKDFAAP
ncbi:MAG: type II toxin-antitoxin system VapC family toxin [Trichlorobacter sp.]|jgi:predicted nucleic acid-binding protein